MTQTIALISGGTAGVGLSIVRALANRGAQVHFIGTSAEKGRRVEAELVDAGHPTCRFVRLDLTDLRAVRAFAREFTAEMPHLDVLANVAGVMLPDRQETGDGLEKTFTIGHLAPYLLCRELTESLAKAEHPRIANVSGLPMQVLKPALPFDGLDFSRDYSGIRTAIHTVHAKTVMTQILAEALAERGIDVNAFHPGTVRSDLGRNFAAPLRAALKLARPFLSTVSKSGVHVCTSEDLRGVTGQLFVGKKPRRLDFAADYRQRLGEVSDQMLAGVLG